MNIIEAYDACNKRERVWIIRHGAVHEGQIASVETGGTQPDLIMARVDVGQVEPDDVHLTYAEAHAALQRRREAAKS